MKETYHSVITSNVQYLNLGVTEFGVFTSSLPKESLFMGAHCTSSTSFARMGPDETWTNFALRFGFNTAKNITTQQFYAEFHQNHFSNQESALKFIVKLQRMGLLMSSCRCSICGRDMLLKYNKSYSELFIWICHTPNHEEKRSIRHKSYFSKYRITISQFMIVLFMWSDGISRKQTIRDSGMTGIFWPFSQ